MDTVLFSCTCHSSFGDILKIFLVRKAVDEHLHERLIGMREGSKRLRCGSSAVMIWRREKCILVERKVVKNNKDEYFAFQM